MRKRRNPVRFTKSPKPFEWERGHRKGNRGPVGGYHQVFDFNSVKDVLRSYEVSLWGGDRSQPLYGTPGPTHLQPHVHFGLWRGLEEKYGASAGGTVSVMYGSDSRRWMVKLNRSDRGQNEGRYSAKTRAQAAALVWRLLTTGRPLKARTNPRRRRNPWGDFGPSYVLTVQAQPAPLKGFFVNAFLSEDGGASYVWDTWAAKGAVHKTRKQAEASARRIASRLYARGVDEVTHSTHPPRNVDETPGSWRRISPPRR